MSCKISIDDVISVFDDFMRGEVDEDELNTFLEMIKDKAEKELTMTFDTIRFILTFIEMATESNIDDYKVLIYSTDPLYMGKTMVYGDIPDCFNCKVHAFDIDLDKKIIFIRSEVVNNGKI